MRPAIDLAQYFVPGARLATARGEATITACPVAGTFSVGRTRVVACDPWLIRGAPPFAREWTGRGPLGAWLIVRVAEARFDDPGLGTRNAAAIATFTVGDEARARTWQLALREGTSPEAYGVDYGMGCFLNANLASRIASNGKLYETLTSALGERSARRREVAVSGSGRVVAFDSGLGDGRYRSYWGDDEHGSAVALVTDFVGATGVWRAPG